MQWTERDASWPLAEIQVHGRVSVRFDHATWHKRRGWSPPPAKDLLGTCTDDPCIEKMGGGGGGGGGGLQDFLGWTALSAQTSTECLGSVPGLGEARPVARGLA